MDLQFDGNLRNSQKFLASLLHTGNYFAYYLACPPVSPKHFGSLRFYLYFDHVDKEGGGVNCPHLST